MLAAVRISVTIAVMGFVSVLLTSGCAEKAGSGQAVAIPIVSVSCTTSNCRQPGSARAIAVYTTSSCANVRFGETVTGSTTVSCSISGCTGTITNFTDANSLSVNTIPEGFYSVCVVVDFNLDYAGTAASGDSNGALASTFITAGTTTRIVNAFTDLL